MKKITLTSSYLQECLKQARYHEFCKDLDRALTVLQPIWTNIEEPPDLDGLSEREGWEVLLICGSVISSYGTTHQKKHFKELAANMLTRAREMAIATGERDLIAESEKQMAIAYWRHGQVDNAVAFLNTVLSKYSEVEQLTNPVCLLAQANLLMLYVNIGQPETAFSCFEKLKPFVDASDDLWLKTGFYNQAAGIYVSTGNFKKAIPLLEKGIEYASLTKNNSYLGNALNNLANAYIHLSDSKKAMTYVNQAIELFRLINQVFPYALALETKSLIHLNDGDFEKALLLIDESIKILEQGENYSELCESLWTRTEILAKTGEKKQAIRQFNNLLHIANENLNLLSGDRYIEQFSKLLYLPTGKSLEEKERNFRAFLLDAALAKCGGIVTSTANHLGMMHQTLSAMLKKFPALVEKHQVKLRVRSRSILPTSQAKEKTLPDFAMRLQTERLAHLGLNKGMIINVRRMLFLELDLSKPVVIKDKNKKYHCGFLLSDFGMLAFGDGRGSMERIFMPEDIAEAGQVIGVFDPVKNEFSDIKF